MYLSACPPELDRDVLALDEAAFTQATAECSDEVRGILRRPGAHKPDHRHRWLLRARRQRLRRRAA